MKTEQKRNIHLAGDTSQAVAGHTPGPWKACRAHEDFDGPYYNIDPEEQAVHDAKPFVSIKASSGENVAAAHDLFKFKTANALLIASAPDLFDLIKKIQDALATAETGDALIEVARNANRAEQELASYTRLSREAGDSLGDTLDEYERAQKAEMLAIYARDHFTREAEAHTETRSRLDAAYAELKKCNDDWNERYSRMLETEGALQEELFSLRAFKRGVDESLNSGDGSYRP